MGSRFNMRILPSRTNRQHCTQHQHVIVLMKNFFTACPCMLLETFCAQYGYDDSCMPFKRLPFSIFFSCCQERGRSNTSAKRVHSVIKRLKFHHSMHHKNDWII